MKNNRINKNNVVKKKYLNSELNVKLDKQYI